MRIKRGTVRAKKRTRLFRQVKGYRWGRKKLVKLAHTAILKAGAHAYRDRRAKKRLLRRSWQETINAAARQHDLSYSRFMGALRKHHIEIDRKILAELAVQEPQAFSVIVDAVKKSR